MYYDSFSDRLVYPIRNPDGKIVNVGGRTLDPAWKEKGLRKYTYFMAWGELKTIYGLAENMEGIREREKSFFSKDVSQFYSQIHMGYTTLVRF